MASFTLVLILGACYPDGKENEGILVGTYYADYAEDEYIKVTSSGIYYHIRYRDPKSLAGQYIDRKFNYSLADKEKSYCRWQQVILYSRSWVLTIGIGGMGR